MAGRRVAIDHPIDTDDGAVPAAIRRFLRNRLMEFVGFVGFVLCVAVGVALATWSPSDPSLSRAVEGTPGNFLGYPGAIVSDQLMQLFGLGVVAAIALPLLWSMRLMTHYPINRPIRSVFAWLICAFMASAFLAMITPPEGFALEAGFGGQAGEVLKSGVLAVLNLGFKGFFASFVAAALFGAGAVMTGATAAGFSRSDSAFSAALGYWIRWTAASVWSLVHALFQRWRMLRQLKAQDRAFRARAANAARKTGRVEPRLDRNAKRLEKDNPPWLKLPASDEDEDIDARMNGDEEGEEDEDEDDDAGAATSRRVSARANQTIRQAKSGRKQRRKSEFELPALTLLAEPKKNNRAVELSPRNARAECPGARRRARGFRRQGPDHQCAPGPRGDALRARTRARHQIVARHQPRRRYRPLDERRLGARRGGAGAQRHRHRAAQLQARDRLSARTPGLRSLREDQPESGPRARQEHRRRTGLRRSRPHAASADRRHDGLRQIGRHQHDDPFAALSPHARPLQAHHDRSQDARALGLRGHPASARRPSSPIRARRWWR